MNNLAVVLVAALFVIVFFLYFRHQAKSPIRYSFAIRKMVHNDYCDITGYLLKGWSTERAAAEINQAYDIAGVVYERSRAEAEKEIADKKKQSPLRAQR